LQQRHVMVLLWAMMVTIQLLLMTTLGMNAEAAKRGCRRQRKHPIDRAGCSCTRRDWAMREARPSI
jgi:hypothetical protein